MVPASAPPEAGSPFGGNASASGSTSRPGTSSTSASGSSGMARKISGNAFAPKRPSGLANSFAASETAEEQEDEEVEKVNLVPSAYPRRGRRKWSEGGRTLGVAVSGTGSENLMWIRKKASASCCLPSIAACALTDSCRRAPMRTRSPSSAKQRSSCQTRRSSLRRPTSCQRSCTSSTQSATRCSRAYRRCMTPAASIQRAITRVRAC